MTTTIETVTLDCQTNISNLLAAVTGDGCFASNVLHSRDVEQMQDRFNQWAGNLGALQSLASPKSLEYRLRDAPLIRDSILHSLADLSSSVQAATDITLGKRQNRMTGSSTEENIDLSEYDLSSSESDSSSLLSLEDRNALAPTSEMQELMSAIRTGLDSLFKASIFIRKFSSENKRLRAAETRSFDNRADAMYIKDRYPLLNKTPTLVARLGEANARRRQYFKYSRDHNERLSTVTTDGNSDNVTAQAHPVVTIPRPAKTVLTAQTKPSLLAQTEATALMAETAEARMLRKFEALEAKSQVSFATFVAETSDEELPFPPVPAEACNGSPFLCPYCFQPQQFKRGDLQNQWRKHVLRDLEPYICTFSTCSLDTFHSQHAWFEHELLVHRSRWICSQCSADISSSDGLKSHVNQHHQGLISDRQLSAYVGQSKRPIDCVKPSECPFCDDSWAQADLNRTSREEVLVVSLDQFRQHLGKHLQQVALFSLPRLIQGHDHSSGRHNDSEVPDRDAISEGNRWIRDDCGYGWSIVSRKWRTFLALAMFLDMCRTQYHQTHAMTPILNLNNVDHESEDEKNETPSSYTKVEVLLLCWENYYSDMATKEEIDDLKATFEDQFNYHVEMGYLDVKTKVQVSVNAIMALFVAEHNNPNTLLIVYYAGHGKSGLEYASLELFGQTSPNDKQKENDTQKVLDRLVWNKTETILMEADVDILEIFDCCYAGQLGLRTKGQRSFEYLAATQEMDLTPRPGKDSFTRALIYALKALVEKRQDGRFTTVELLNKIKEAPDFPKDQNPMLSDREKKGSAGRIMLHPLQ